MSLPATSMSIRNPRDTYSIASHSEFDVPGRSNSKVEAYRNRVQSGVREVSFGLQMDCLANANGGWCPATRNMT